MKRLLLIFIIILIWLSSSAGMDMRLDLHMGPSSSGVTAGHYLLVDGAGNYLLIDGSSHKLRIDGAS